MRKIIFHYHLFKNAGTSLDFTLKQHFSPEKSEWVTAEFPAHEGRNRALVRDWVMKNESALCFSSHTAFLPTPSIEGVEVFPIMFVRHPIDRIASAYAFEKKQGADTFGSVLARNTDLKGYIETRLSVPIDRQCRNFHVQRLATNHPSENISEVEKAKRAIKDLPFIGLVEKFSDSLSSLTSKLQDFGFENIHLEATEQNVSQKKSDNLKDKLDIIRDKIGTGLYTKLLEANKDDLEIYRLVSGMYE